MTEAENRGPRMFYADPERKIIVSLCWDVDVKELRDYVATLAFSENVARLGPCEIHNFDGHIYRVQTPNAVFLRADWKLKFRDHVGPDYVNAVVDGGILATKDGSSAVAPSAFVNATIDQNLEGLDGQ